MLNRKLKLTTIALVILLLSGIAFGYLSLSRKKQLTISGQTVLVDIADDDDERHLGLGGRDELADNEGMLFIFDQSDDYGITMRDVDFPIDVLWLNKSKQIVYIESEMRPDSYPTVFRPDKPALYVVELPAGFVGKYSVKEGDVVEW